MTRKFKLGGKKVRLIYTKGEKGSVIIPLSRILPEFGLDYAEPVRRAKKKQLLNGKRVCIKQRGDAAWPDYCLIPLWKRKRSR
jgi:hypothetical protein